MGTGHSSGAANARDGFAAGDLLSLAHQISFIVSINRHESVRVTQDHHVAVTAQLVAINNLAAVNGVDRRAFRRRNVNAVVKVRAAGAEPGVDRAADGPDERLV